MDHLFRSSKSSSWHRLSCPGHRKCETRMRASARLLAIRLRPSTFYSRLAQCPRAGRILMQVTASRAMSSKYTPQCSALWSQHRTPRRVCALTKRGVPTPGLLPFPFPSPLPCHQTCLADVAASTDLSAFEVLRLWQFLINRKKIFKKYSFGDTCLRSH